MYLYACICVCLCVWASLCVANLPGLSLRVPHLCMLTCLNVLAPCARPTVQLAVRSWPGGCACPPDERWQVCNKPLVTVTFLSSSSLPGRGLTAGWSSRRVSGCVAAPTPTLRARLQPDGEQLANVGLVPLPCPRQPQGMGLGLVYASPGGVGSVPKSHGFAGYYPELRGSWGGEGRSR